DLTAPNPPVVTNFAAFPVTNNVNQATFNLAGTRDVDTEVFADGVSAGPNGAGPWTRSISLGEGVSTVALHAVDLGGNTSAVSHVVFFVDSLAPVMIGIEPNNFVFTNNNSIVVDVAYTETGSGLDLSGSTLSVLSNGLTQVAGNWTTDGATATFTPSAALGDAEYNLALTFRDGLSNASPPFLSRFTVDTTPPAPPSVDPVVSPTMNDSQLITGTREPFAEVRMPGMTVFAAGANPSWNYLANLMAFSNLFAFTQVDRAGNESAPTNVVIYYADPPPLITGISLPDDGSATNSAIIRSFTLNFSEPLNPATVSNLAHFSLSSSNVTNALSIDYPTGTLSATLSIHDGPLQEELITFTASTNLMDRVGNRLQTQFVHRFSVVGVPYFDLESRSNDTRASATLLALNEDPTNRWAAGGRGHLETTNDVDLYRFNANADDVVLLGVEVPANQLRFRIENNLGVPLGTDLVPPANGTGETAAMSIPTPGDYFVRVEAEDPYLDEYRFLLLLARPPLLLESEPNDTVGSATALTNTSVAGYVAHNPDLDIFDLGLVTNNLTILLSVTQPTNSGLNPVVGVVNALNQLMSEAPGGDPDDGFAEVRITSNGTYYARIEDGDARGSLLHGYVLNADIQPTASLTLPNLRAAELNNPAGGSLSGQPASFSYVVTNTGPLATPSGVWTDRVVMSMNTIFGDGDDLLLGDFVHNGILNPSNAYTNAQTVNLADGIDGDFYLIISVDHGNEVDEGFFEADNVRVSAGTFHVDRSDYPDLVIE
ncbi:MAG: Ig-like domain-containing protein, partial [Verrucomicrobiota bacterium]